MRNSGYSFSEDSIAIGRPFVMDRILQSETVVLPLKTLVLHGMIGGSTGTGKTRLIQLIAENANETQIPVLLADLKGDISGFIRPNDSPDSKTRANVLGSSFFPKPFSTNFFSVSNRFIPLRLKLESIDPVLIARILKLNPTQESNLRMAFLYAQQKGYPVRDLIDLQTILTYLEKHPNIVPGASSSSLDVIIRQVVLAIGEGLNDLFGEQALEIQDLLEPTNSKINVINLGNWRKRSELPSVLMGFILYRLFHELDDVGSLEKPRLILFIDEAHYLFQDANPSLVSLFVTILKQIRSKGVAVFFSTQNPEDLPEKILEQLGCKIEFALRAFTRNELKDIKGVANSFPPTKRFDISKELVSLGIGQAIVSPLDESGRPMEPTKVMIAPPRSFMGVPSDEEIHGCLNQILLAKYHSSMTGISRYDLNEPLENIRVRQPTSPWTINKEAQKYERAETRKISQNWSRFKMAGAFVLIFLFLVFLIVIGLAVIFLR